MAKSAGNFFTLRDLTLEKGWSGREVRYALLSVKYREPLNFTIEGLSAARNALARLDEFCRRIREIAAAILTSPGENDGTSDAPTRDGGDASPGRPSREVGRLGERSLPMIGSPAFLARQDVCAGGAKRAEHLNIAGLEAFGSALDDDLNISAALAAVFDVVRETNRRIDLGEISPEAAKCLVEWLRGVQSVLAMEPEDEEVPREVHALAGLRAQARAAKDWKSSDSLRDQIQAHGWVVKDSKDGQKLTKGVSHASS